jgi:hypothetical protein
MRSTLNLKQKSKDRETLIYLKACFKNEGKKFVYSTGEKIHPKEWDSANRQPNNLTGRTLKADNQRVIKTQLNRYTDFFSSITDLYKNTEQEITIENIKKEFDKEFKKVKTDTRSFFIVYDKCLQNKIDDRTDESNATTTIKRYEYNKKLLEDFETSTGRKLHNT